MPIVVDIKGKVYKDKIEISTREFYEKIKEKDVFPKTSLVSPASFVEIFSREIEKGNEVIYITVSSKLSGTHNAATIAKDMIGSDKINIIDSKNVSSGSALLILEASRLAKEGKCAKEIIEHIESILDKQKCLGYIEDMEMLKRGGRIPQALATIGGILNIKPVLTIKDGRLETITKARGKKAAFKKIADGIKSEEIDKKYPVMIAHANNLEYATELINILEDTISDAEIIISEIGPSVGTHAGEGAVVIWVVTK